MPSDQALRAQIRQEVLLELRNLLQSEAGLSGDYVLLLSGYELANLREALIATGYGSVFYSPLAVLNNGDWLGQIVQKLYGLAQDTQPNSTSQQLADAANQWRSRA